MERVSKKLGVDIIAKELFNIQKKYDKEYLKIIANKNDEMYTECLEKFIESYKNEFGNLSKMVTEYINIISLLEATGYDIEHLDFYKDEITGKYSVRLNVTKNLYEYSPRKYEEAKQKYLKKFFSLINDDNFGKDEIRILEQEVKKLKDKHLYLLTDQAIMLDLKKRLMIVSDFGEIYVEVVGEKVY